MLFLKNLSFTILFSLFGLISYSQTTEASFKVAGNCDMCKERIEEAALRTAGVKFAEWDEKSQLLAVVYKSKKTSESEIQKNIAAVGHNAGSHKATKETYADLPKCCQYQQKSCCSSKSSCEKK